MNTYVQIISAQLRPCVNALHYPEKVFASIKQLNQMVEQLLVDQRHSLPAAWLEWAEMYYLQSRQTLWDSPLLIAVGYNHPLYDFLSGQEQETRDTRDKEIEIHKGQTLAGQKLCDTFRDKFEELWKATMRDQSAITIATNSESELADKLRNLANEIRTTLHSGRFNWNDAASEDVAVTLEESARAYLASIYIAVICLCGRALEGMTRMIAARFVKGMTEEQANSKTFSSLSEMLYANGTVQTLDKSLQDTIRRYRNAYAHAAMQTPGGHFCNDAQPDQAKAILIIGATLDQIGKLLSFTKKRLG